MFDTNLGWVGRRWENVEKEIRSVCLNPMLWYLVILLPCLIDRQFSISLPLKRKIETKGIFQEVLPSYLFFIKQTLLFCSSHFMFFLFSSAFSWLKKTLSCHVIIILPSFNNSFLWVYVLQPCISWKQIQATALRGWFYTITFKILDFLPKTEVSTVGKIFHVLL